GPERVDESVIGAAVKCLSFGLQMSAAKLHVPLQIDKLVQGKTAPGSLDIIQRFREMQNLDRLGAREESSIECPRLTNLACEPAERSPNQRSQPSLGQALGERINRRDAIEMNQIFFAGLDHFGFRMVDRARPE